MKHTKDWKEKLMGVTMVAAIQVVATLILAAFGLDIFLAMFGVNIVTNAVMFGRTKRKKLPIPRPVVG